MVQHGVRVPLTDAVAKTDLLRRTLDTSTAQADPSISLRRAPGSWVGLPRLTAGEGCTLLPRHQHLALVTALSAQQEDGGSGIGVGPTRISSIG